MELQPWLFVEGIAEYLGSLIRDKAEAKMQAMNSTRILIGKVLSLAGAST